MKCAELRNLNLLIDFFLREAAQNSRAEYGDRLETIKNELETMCYDVKRKIRALTG